MVNAGRVMIVPKGQFEYGTQYTRLDMVAYNGGIYVAKKDNISVYPADGENSEYWMCMMKSMDVDIDSKLSAESDNPVQNKVITAELKKYLPLSGGTMTGTLSAGNYIITQTDAGAKNAGYINICTININTEYVDSPVCILFARRHDEDVIKLILEFNGSSSFDPTLNIFTYETNEKEDINIFIAKISSGIWKIYIEKSETYDMITIYDFHKRNQSGYVFSWDSEFVFEEDLPEGRVAAKRVGVYQTNKRLDELEQRVNEIYDRVV